MPSIKDNRVGFYATFAGSTTRSDGDVFFKLKLPSSEIGAAVFLYSLYEHELLMKVKADDSWLQFGRCFHKKIVGDEEGASTIDFRSHLSDWHVTSEELLSLKDKSLTVVVKDVSELNIKYSENVNANEEGV